MSYDGGEDLWRYRSRASTARLLSEPRKRRAPLLETVALVVVTMLGLTLIAAFWLLVVWLVLVL